jgi:hypothetical protein
MSWFETEEQRMIREHNEGQEAGSKAGFLDQLLHDNIESFLGTTEYDKGYHNGVANPSKNDN